MDRLVCKVPSTTSICNAFYKCTLFLLSHLTVEILELLDQFF